MVRYKSNVTLRCWTHFQNVTVTLGKLHNSEYQQQLRSAAKEAEFHLTHVQPEDAGGYFCAYRTAASHRWSAQSQHLQLVVTGEPSSLRPSPHMFWNYTFFIYCVCMCVHIRTPACVRRSGDKLWHLLISFSPWTFKTHFVYVCMIFVCTCGCKGTMAHMWRSEDTLGWWSSSCLVWSRVSFLYCYCVLHANWPESFQRSLCLYLPLPWGSAGTTGTTRCTNPVLHGLWVSELRSLILGPLPTRSFSQSCFLSFKIIMLS